MLRPQVHTACSYGPYTRSPLLGCQAALLPSSRAAGSLLPRVRPARGRAGSSRKGSRSAVRCSSGSTVETVTKTAEASTKVKAVVTVKLTVGGLLTNIGMSGGLDEITDMLGKSIFLELLSAELEPETGLERATVGSFVHKTKREGDTQSYEGELTVPKGFGEIGVLLVTNEHHREMFLLDVVLFGYGDGPVTFHCHSWVHAKSDNPEKRIFFCDKSYLPSKTPDGLQRLRKEELQTLRGDGQGERKRFERIYDYDVYNDLGEPKSENTARPVLGGHKFPYPRRCRTGRPRTHEDPQSEKRSNFVYVPRDESFSEVKGVTFSAKTVRSVLHALIPSLETAILNPNLGFPIFTSIDVLFKEGIDLPPPQHQGLLQTMLPRMVKAITDGKDNVLLFEPPALLDSNPPYPLPFKK